MPFHEQLYWVESLIREFKQWRGIVAWTTLVGLVGLALVAGRLFTHSKQSSGQKNVIIDSKTMGDERVLVEEARRLLVSSGDAQKDVVQAMHALAALVSAVRIKDGDAAATALLERGRALFQEREGTDAEREAAMFSLGEDGSLLKERGAEDILCDAFADGSSVLCRKCSGLVSRARWQAHKTQWCPANMSQYDLDDGEDDGHDDDGEDKMDLE